jgi:membrane-bound lytic murein transglycosylase D
MLKTKFPITLFSITLLSGCAQQLPSANIIEPLTPQVATLSVEPATTDKTTEPTNIVQQKESLEVVTTPSEADKSLVETDDLLARIRDGFQFTHNYNTQAYQDQLKWYASHQSYFDSVLNRSALYLYHIVDEIDAKGLPTELALLPIVESAYDPFAYSHSHAAGLWQFVPDTGKHYGLEKNWWYEGRRDVVASTAAALKYLHYLNKKFDGDWLLALAAYNSGEGTVGRAIRRNKKEGKPTDFWSLKLPKETRAYVPQLLAISSIVQNPQQYGITLVNIPNQPYFEEVYCDAQLDLAQAAAMAEISTEELYRLNPAYNRWTTPPGSDHKVLIPTYCVDKFKTTLANTPKDQWIASREYFVKSGDSLGKIAQKNKVSVADLRRENALKSNLIRIGQVLKIPGSGANRTSIGGARKSYYQVRSGDSLSKIAHNNNVKINELLAWNNLSPKDKIQPGQQLQVSSRKPNYTTRKMKYKVRQGDSLGRIANKFNLLIADIASWNKLNPKRYLQPGQRLTLYIDVQKI